MKIPDVPPRFRSKLARERWTRIAEDLIKHGLDASARVELISDYVDAENHITSLRPQSKGTGDMKLARARALNVATAERRRLHQRLFAGAKRLEEVLPSLEAFTEVIVAGDQSEADAAWRAHFLTGKGLIRDASASRDMHRLEAERLEAKYGEPSWNALLYETVQQQAEADRALEALWRAKPSQRRRLDEKGAK
ncbi:hypothetical protein EDC40_10359 [Aminobacter aminovorans]|uniref:Uncharacterized protein n=1 Tax=Aminobacter aminovorans TaxID=83263 RepID=A0A380WLW4_AMIAI|nr:hypothetical protein [Aminobacter aminovorans]TCS27594.1 hypothetical protein EDC40_10359 [Aminobacter aminovorans]SUU89993.1 Uncharacterised protein [Aminobacter aminovorans]